MRLHTFESDPEEGFTITESSFSATTSTSKKPSDSTTQPDFGAVAWSAVLIWIRSVLYQSKRVARDNIPLGALEKKKRVGNFFCPVSRVVRPDIRGVSWSVMLAQLVTL
jgi:hypothetical protein